MNNQKVRFGILGTARIAVKQVIPALQAGRNTTVLGLASRNLERAAVRCAELDIKKAFGSYDELVNDPGIDAIYIPLPNHLHIKWSILALQAGKHVLCEKPLGCSEEEVSDLIQNAAEFPSLKLMEGFMYRFHPQWNTVKELIAAGEIGELRTVHTHFSYFNDDAKNIRNIAGYGGGGLLDIGCYAVSSARLLFGEEPISVSGMWEKDDAFEVDRIASGLLEFRSGEATFQCATQLHYFQQTEIFGSKGRIVLERPFNPHVGQPATVKLANNKGEKLIEIPEVNQFTLMVEHFADAVLQKSDTAIPLRESIANMRVLDAIGQSAAFGQRIAIQAS